MDPADRVLLKKMLGLSEQAKLPKAVVDAYARYHKMWHRVANGALSDIGGHVLLPIADAASVAGAVEPETPNPIPAPGNSVARTGLDPALIEPGTPVVAAGRTGTWMGYKDGTTRILYSKDEEVRGIPLDQIELAGKPSPQPEVKKDDIPPTNDILTPSPPLGTGLTVEVKGETYKATFNGRMANGMVKVKIPDRPKTKMVSVKAVKEVAGPEE